jgi:hypothetical protein
VPLNENYLNIEKMSLKQKKYFAGIAGNKY